MGSRLRSRLSLLLAMVHSLSGRDVHTSIEHRLSLMYTASSARDERVNSSCVMAGLSSLNPHMNHLCEGSRTMTLISGQASHWRRDLSAYRSSVGSNAD